MPISKLYVAVKLAEPPCTFKINAVAAIGVDVEISAHALSVLAAAAAVAVPRLDADTVPIVAAFIGLDRGRVANSQRIAVDYRPITTRSQPGRV